MVLGGWLLRPGGQAMTRKAKLLAQAHAVEMSHRPNALFALVDDKRPASQRTAAIRYEEPDLLTFIEESKP